MTKALDGTHFKIIWANHHLAAVQTICREYVGAKPYGFPMQPHQDFVLVGRPMITSQPFLDLGGHIGDCLTNCMAVLDYIIWHLAGKAANRDLVPPQSGGIKPKTGWDTPSFPLYIDPDDYRANGRLKKYPFATDVEREIEAVQPYNAGYEPLGLLYRLVNQDKHRERIYTLAEIESGDITAITHGTVMESPLVSSAERVVFKAPYPPDTPEHERKVKVHAQVTTRITWSDPTMPREPVEITLYNIVRVVNEVSNRFTPRLL